MVVLPRYQMSGRRAANLAQWQRMYAHQLQPPRRLEATVLVKPTTVARWNLRLAPLDRAGRAARTLRRRDSVSTSSAISQRLNSVATWMALLSSSTGLAHPAYDETSYFESEVENDRQYRIAHGLPVRYTNPWVRFSRGCMLFRTRRAARSAG
jgi:hypothetical protein